MTVLLAGKKCIYPWKSRLSITISSTDSIQAAVTIKELAEPGLTTSKTMTEVMEAEVVIKPSGGRGPWKRFSNFCTRDTFIKKKKKKKKIRGRAVRSFEDVPSSSG